MRAHAAIVFVLASACGYGGLVEREFRRVNSACSSDPVTVVSHPEIAAHRIDPLRYGMPLPHEYEGNEALVKAWKESQTVHGKPYESFAWDGESVYEARGCGVTKWYACATTSEAHRHRVVQNDSCDDGVPPGPP